MRAVKTRRASRLSRRVPRTYGIDGAAPARLIVGGMIICHTNGILMARKRNRIPTKTFTVATTPQVFDYLGQLVDTGLYGKTEADAAERLLTRSLDDFLGAKRVSQRRRYRR